MLEIRALCRITFVERSPYIPPRPLTMLFPCPHRIPFQLWSSRRLHTCFKTPVLCCLSLHLAFGERASFVLSLFRHGYAFVPPYFFLAFSSVSHTTCYSCNELSLEVSLSMTPGVQKIMRHSRQFQRNGRQGLLISSPGDAEFPTN